MSRYIDADKLKSEFDFKHIDMNKTAAFVHHCNILEIINQQPTADVRENVRGHWITCTEDNTRLSCSVCGADFYGTVGFIFCPNCGAQMGENDE